MSHAIEIDKVSKTFRPARGIGKWLSASPISHPIPVLKEVTLSIGKGEIFGLLGPNGAGKTTLLKILATLIRPERGAASVSGYDVVRDEERVRERLGFVYTNERSFYWRLSGRENLRFFGSLANIPGKDLDGRILELSPFLGMEGFIDDRYDAYSTGMKQRLSVARGLLGRPEVLLMDEPTRGLDPTAAENLLRKIRSLALEREVTVLMVTHSLSEAERFCDRIGILDRGTLVCQGDVEELRRSFQPAVRYRFHVTSLDTGVLERMQGLSWIRDLHWSGEREGVKLDLEIEEPAKNLSGVFALFYEKHVAITHLEARESSLNAIFEGATRREAG